MIGADLLRFSKRPTLLFDIECQRLNLLDDNLPFQCSLIVTDKSGIIHRSDHYLHWPDYRVSADAARITHFNPDWVRNGDDPETVLEEFESFLLDESLDIAGQNILGFDCYIHQLWRRALGRKPDFSYLTRLYDTNVLSRAYKMGWKPDRSSPSAFLAWQYKVMGNPVKGVKTNLGLMGRELGMDVDENKLHDAGYDLVINHFVHRKLINLMEI